MQLRHIIIILSIFAVISLGVFSFNFFSGMKPKIPEIPTKEIIPFVRVKKVAYSTANSSIRATGRLTSQNDVDLSAEVQGRILAGGVNLKKGQRFKKGQLLLNIYDKEAQLALQAHKSRFLTMVANLLPDFKIDFTDSYANWNAFFEKTNIKEPIPELPNVKSAKEKVYLSTRNILSDYYTIKSEEIRLSKYKVYAPFDGSYTDVFAQTGAIANPGARLAKMVRTDKLELEVPVETENAKHIKIGDPVLISPKGDSNTKIHGTVSRKADFVDTKTQSVLFFISLQTTNKVLQGEYLWAEFSNISVKNSMEIPRNATFNNNEVFVVENNKLVKKQINILKINGSTIYINALKLGTNLVIEPLINASENMKVKPIFN